MLTVDPSSLLPKARLAVEGPTLITTLASVYPARRAASVDPITSLRHE